MTRVHGHPRWHMRLISEAFIGATLIEIDDDFPQSNVPGGINVAHTLLEGIDQLIIFAGPRSPVDNSGTLKAYTSIYRIVRPDDNVPQAPLPTSLPSFASVLFGAGVFLRRKRGTRLVHPAGRSSCSAFLRAIRDRPPWLGGPVELMRPVRERAWRHGKSLLALTLRRDLGGCLTMRAFNQKFPKSRRSRTLLLANLGFIAVLAMFAQTAAAQREATRAQQQPALSQVENQQLQLISNVDGLEIHLKGSHSIGGGNPGEVQSTVVPPKKKDQCPNGRLLASNDQYKSPGRVYRFDFDEIVAANAYAIPQAIPGPSSVSEIASNDHDLVTLNNGDVLLLKMGRTIASLNPKPGWFDYTYKISSDRSSTWGPGARSILYVWRSEDCGESFSLRSSIDTALMNDGYGATSDGSAGGPQYWEGPVTSSPGSAQQPIWQMGGTDGPLAKVDRATNKVFYSIGIVGDKRDTTQSGYHLYNDKINRATVALSADRGETWSDAITLPFRGWRLEVVPIRNNRVAFLSGGGWACGARSATNECWRIHLKDLGPSRSSTVDPGTDLYIPRINPWTNISNKKDPGRMNVNGTDVLVWKKQNQAVLARSPSSNGVILAVPEMMPGQGGYGYGLYFVDAAGNYTPMQKVAPMVANGKGVIFHLAAIDLGVGPVMLYWYDINAAEQKIQVRGRLITADSAYTSDFPVSLPFDAPTTSTWFGDYQMSGGHARNLRQLTQVGQQRVAISNPPTFEYFPVWKQPDGEIHFGQVVYEKPSQAIVAGHHPLKETAKPKIAVNPQNLRQLTPDRYEREDQ